MAARWKKCVSSQQQREYSMLLVALTADRHSNDAADACSSQLLVRSMLTSTASAGTTAMQLSTTG